MPAHPRFMAPLQSGQQPPDMSLRSLTAPGPTPDTLSVPWMPPWPCRLLARLQAESKLFARSTDAIVKTEKFHTGNGGTYGQMRTLRESRLEYAPVLRETHASARSTKPIHMPVRSGSIEVRSATRADANTSSARRSALGPRATTQIRHRYSAGTALLIEKQGGTISLREA